MPTSSALNSNFAIGCELMHTFRLVGFSLEKSIDVNDDVNIDWTIWLAKRVYSRLDKNSDARLRPWNVVYVNAMTQVRSDSLSRLSTIPIGQLVELRIFKIPVCKEGIYRCFRWVNTQKYADGMSLQAQKLGAFQSHAQFPFAILSLPSSDWVRTFKIELLTFSITSKSLKKAHGTSCLCWVPGRGSIQVN